MKREEMKKRFWEEHPFLLKAKIMDLYTGGKPIIVLNEKDALSKDIYPLYRVEMIFRNERMVSIVDLSKELVSSGEVGLPREVAERFGINEGDYVEIRHMPRPKSIEYIRKKLDGRSLDKPEMYEIIRDVVDDRLSEGELGAFVAAMYIRGLDDNEVVYLTQSLVETGDTLDLNVEPIVDKHCIGGVANNRTTMLVVPIIAAAGVYIPKTSSRAITSAAGTADTVEVLAPVALKIDELREVVLKTHGAMVWGGAMNLATADDKLIRIRHPLSLDPRGVLLASILAKKKSVGAQHVIIDIPIGRGAKVEDASVAEDLAQDFIKIGKRLGMNIVALMTDGSEPIGAGVGPALEARDVLKILDGDGPQDLKEKSIVLAGRLLEMAGKVPEGRGQSVAREILDSGKAKDKFWEIIEAQGGQRRKPDDLPIGQYTYDVEASQDGKIHHIHNKYVARIARAAGSPFDKGAGLYLHVKKGDRVKKGDVLFTIYAESETKLDYAVKSLDIWNPIEMKKIVFGEFR